MAEAGKVAFFDEDEVSTFIESKGVYKCGLVLHSSEYSSDDDDEDDDNDLFEKVKAGTAKVAWYPDGEEQVVDVDRLTLEDRSLMPGDVVRRLVAGQDSQRGYVINTSVKCHLHVLGTDFVIYGVDSKDLITQTPWDMDPGDVCLDSWVGKLYSVSEVLHLRLPDGTVFCVDCDNDPGADHLEDFLQKRDFDTEFFSTNFYKGQYLKTTIKKISKELKRDNPKSPWIKRPGNTEVVCVVEKVETKQIEVQWLCQGYAQADTQDNINHHPPRKLKSEQIKRLKSLDCFKSCCSQAGDPAMYTVKSSDNLRNLEDNDTENPFHGFRKDQNAISIIKENTRNLINNSTEIELPSMTDGAGDSASKPMIPQHNDSQVGSEIGLSIPVEKSLSEIAHKDKLGDIQDFVIAPNKPKSTRGKDTNKSSNKKATIKDRVMTGDSIAEPSSETEQVPAENVSEHDTEPTACALSDKSSDDDDPDFELKDAVSARTVPVRKSVGARKGIRGLKSKRTRATPPLVMPPMERKLPTPGDTVAVEVFYTASIIDVMWQDGSVENGLTSCELHPIHHLDQLEFFPGDYVVPSTDTVDHNIYGVIETVNHTERTCYVHWLKPYQIGQGNRPDEQIMSKEVSVYDITDHSNYNFRPGRVVVRVGGYEGRDSTDTLSAVGQVYTLCKDGRLLIQWADTTQSHCYPQEVYLIDNELSELGDSLDDSDSDDEFSSGNSEDSWETEDEEEEMGERESEDNVDSALSVLCVEASQKVDMDHRMSSVVCGLSELEERYDKAWLEEFPDSAPFILEEILRIHQQCRFFDRNLKATYFKDSKLITVIQSVKDLLTKVKEEHRSRQVRNKYLTNTGREQPTADTDQQLSSVPETEQLSSNVNGNKLDKSITEGATLQSPSLEGGTLNSQCTEGSKLNSSLAEGSDPNNSSSAGGEQTSCSTELEREMEAEAKETETIHGGVMASLPCRMCSDSEHCDTNAATGSQASDTDDEDVNVSPRTLRVRILQRVHDAVSTSLEYSGLLEEVLAYFNLKRLNAIDKNENTNDKEGTSSEAAWIQSIVGNQGHSVILLAKLSCRCLFTIIKRIQLDLNQKWEELKRSGKLRVLEESDEEDDEGLTTRENTVNSSAQETEIPASEHSPETPKNKCHNKTGLCLDLSMDKRGCPTEFDRTPMTPQTPADVLAKLDINREGFTIEDEAQEGHKFFSASHEPSDPKAFTTAVRKEMKLLKTGLPNNIFVKGFSDRMDLYSVMMLGPSCTPYEDGLFFFDIQLPNDYPVDPPRVHYIAYCSERLNPNLYEDGKVCVSLLGTWTGRGTEVWSNKSSLLQVLVSIQGLILVAEPYYNEAGYEKQKGSQHGSENSRMYNEMAVLKMVESMTRMTKKPPSIFTMETKKHIQDHAQRMICRLDAWLDVAGSMDTKTLLQSSVTENPSGSNQTSRPDITEMKGAAEGPCVIDTPAVQQLPISSQLPEFPLVPLSKGFQITLRKHLSAFKSVLPEVTLLGNSSPHS